MGTKFSYNYIIAGAQLPQVCNSSVKFQGSCLKSTVGVDYTKQTGTIFCKFTKKLLRSKVWENEKIGEKNLK